MSYMLDKNENVLRSLHVLNDCITNAAMEAVILRLCYVENVLMF